MCIHETIQLSQDGEDTIICGDCGREFGHIAKDERETFVAYVPHDGSLIVVGQDGGDSLDPEGLAIAFDRVGGERIRTATEINRCAECGWQWRCHHDGEECHS